MIHASWLNSTLGMDIYTTVACSKVLLIHKWNLKKKIFLFWFKKEMGNINKLEK